MELEPAYVTLLTMTVLLFANGFFLRRKFFFATIASSSFMITLTLYRVIIVGTKDYVQSIESASSLDWISAIGYCMFFWILGYIVGGIGTKKKNIQDDFPGKVETYIYRIDD